MKNFLEKVDAFCKRVIIWLKANGGGTIGLLQSILKNTKEILTFVLNLVAIFLPAGKALVLIALVRNAINFLDQKLEEKKGKLLEEIAAL